MTLRPLVLCRSARVVGRQTPGEGSIWDPYRTLSIETVHRIWEAQLVALAGFSLLVASVLGRNDYRRGPTEARSDPGRALARTRLGHDTRAAGDHAETAAHHDGWVLGR